MASKTAIIKAQVIADTSDFKKGMKGAGDDAEDLDKKAGGSFKSVGSVAAGFLTAKAGEAALRFGKDLIDLGGQVDTWGKKAETVFGDQIGSMKTWSDQMNESLGLSKEETLNLATSMADLLKPMGFTSEQAGIMSKEMIDLSGALSAWSGGTTSAAEVSEIMTKAMLGETDGLKALGISISAAEIEARLLANGQKDLTGAALAQAKAQATQQLILEKSTDAQAAWADGTMDAVKNQNEAKATLEGLKVTIAQGLTPAFHGLLAFITGTAIPAIASLSTFISENREYVIGVGLVIAGALVPAVIAWATAQWAAASAVIATFAPVIAITAAVAALVAGVIWAYKNWGWFQTAVDAVAGFLKNTLWPVLQDIGRFVGGLFVTYIQTGIKVLGWLRDAAGWVLDKFAWLWPTLRDGAANIFNTFETMVGWVTAIGSRLAAAGQGMWNFIADNFRPVINTVIGWWNSLRFSIPGFDPPGPGPSFSGYTLSVPQISYFAQGGMVKGGHGGVLGVVGEGAEDELVVPLSKVGNLTGGGGTTINVYAPVGSNPRDIGRELRRYLNEYDRASSR